jgi:tRNA(Ile2)-agmatinylcytidine synthase
MLTSGSKQQMHIGFDDTDSTRQGCTTYVAALLVAELEKLKVRFLDYPRLVRLNPNVPWKTRGNGALCLSFEYDQALENQIKDVTVSLIEAHSDLDWKGTDPGIVFLNAAQIPMEISAFAKRALTSIVKVEEAVNLIRKYNGEAHGYNTQQGLVGALAAIGEKLTEDYTYELITYRTKENRGTKRQVDENSIYQMDASLQPYTFNNVDLEKQRVIITPRGPDPILFGVRGETAQTVKQAFDMIKPLEPVERWMIFRTNQGTDAHLLQVESLDQIEPYSSVIVKGTVSKNPKIVPLRHVVFAIKDNTAEVDCAAYEPTGDLRKIAHNLTVGDVVEVYGAVKKSTDSRPLTINLEKIRILHLVSKNKEQNPLCPNCGKRLKSMGKNQGLRCEKCKAKFGTLHKTSESQERSLNLGLYVTSTRSQRHLTKPLRRYGLEKKDAYPAILIENWHSI